MSLPHALVITSGKLNFSPRPRGTILKYYFVYRSNMPIMFESALTLSNANFRILRRVLCISASKSATEIKIPFFFAEEKNKLSAHFPSYPEIPEKKTSTGDLRNPRRRINHRPRLFIKLDKTRRKNFRKEYYNVFFEF